MRTCFEKLVVWSTGMRCSLKMIFESSFCLSNFNDCIVPEIIACKTLIVTVPSEIRAQNNPSPLNRPYSFSFFDTLFPASYNNGQKCWEGSITLEITPSPLSMLDFPGKKMTFLRGITATLNMGKGWGTKGHDISQIVQSIVRARPSISTNWVTCGT